MTQAWSPQPGSATPQQAGAHPMAPGYPAPYPQQAWAPQFPQTTQPVHGPAMPGVPSAARPPQQFEQLDVAPVQLAVQDHQRNVMGAVITLIALVIGLWGALGYLHSTVQILGGIDTSSNQILVKMRTSQTGLETLQEKTAQVQPMANSTVRLASELRGVDTSMTAMLTNVNAISGAMRSMNRSVGTLDSTLSSVNATNTQLAGSLRSINAGLGKQATAVSGMKQDVVASANGLSTIPPKLAATGDRLTAINGDVCVLGQKGVAAPTGIHVGFLGLNTGSATIQATLIPVGAWSC